MATATDVVLSALVLHQEKRGLRDMHVHCECGWVSAAIADGRYEHAKHQADEIVDAQRKAARKAIKTKGTV